MAILVGIHVVQIACQVAVALFGVQAKVGVGIRAGLDPAARGHFIHAHRACAKRGHGHQTRRAQRRGTDTDITKLFHTFLLFISSLCLVPFPPTKGPAKLRLTSSAHATDRVGRLRPDGRALPLARSEEHTSELQSPYVTSYA